MVAADVAPSGAIAVFPPLPSPPPEPHADTLAWCRALAGPSGPGDSEPLLWALIWPRERPRAPQARAGRPRTALHLFGTPRGLWGRLAAANAIGWGVYACPHTMELALTPFGAPLRKPQQIRRWNAWWVDCDSRESVAAVLDLPSPAQPGMVVETSPGRWQVLWRSNETLHTPARDAFRLAAPLREMARQLRGDPAATDPCRVLRVPGFWNTKRATPHLVTLLAAEPGKTWTYDQAVNQFPPPGGPMPEEQAATNRPTADLLGGGLSTADLETQLQQNTSLRDLRSELTAAALAVLPPLVFNLGQSDLDVVRAAGRLWDLGWTRPSELANALLPWFLAGTSANGLPNADLGNRDFLTAKVKNLVRYAKSEPGCVLLLEHAAREAMAAAEMPPPPGMGADVTLPTNEDATPEEQEAADQQGAQHPAGPAPEPGKKPGPPIPIASEEELAEWIIRHRLSAAANLRPVADGALLRAYAPAQGAWIPVSQNALAALARERSAQPAVHLGTRSAIKPLAMSNRMVHAVATSIRERCEVPDFFEKAPPGAAFKGDFAQVTPAGVVLTAAHPDHRARAAFDFPWPDGAPVDLADPDLGNPDHGAMEWLASHAPNFASYLVGAIGADRELEDVASAVRCLQEFSGAAVAGFAPRYERALVLSGDGSNGKGTFLSILRLLFHPDDVTAIPIRRWEDPRFLIKLAGRRLNMIADDWGNEVIQETALKSILSAADPVTARDVYESAVTFTPSAGHVMLCNNLPSTRDQSEGFWRRWLIVEFKGEFGIPGAAPKDTEILARIIPELPQIAAWALLGACRLTDRGDYLVPPASKDALAAWRTDADTALDFVHRACRPAKDGEGTRPDELYSAYREWSISAGHSQPLSARKLARRLRRVLLRGSKRTADGRLWPIHVKPAPEWSWE